MEITVRIRGRTASCPENSVIICGNSDYTVRFAFDREWDAFPEKTAVFRFHGNGRCITEEIPFTGNVCRVPVITGTDKAAIGVYAGNIRTTEPVQIPCAECITDYPAQTYTPQTDVYNRITEALAQHRPPQPEETVLLLRDSEGFALRDAEGYALRTEESHGNPLEGYDTHSRSD